MVQVPVSQIQSGLIHENTLSHISRLTRKFTEHKRFARETIESPLLSPDLNLIKNLCSSEKMNLYAGGKQYNRKADIMEAIKTTMLEIEPAELKNQQNQWIINYWLLLRRRVTISKCKGFKDLPYAFVGRVITKCPETWVQSQVPKTLKMVLDTSLLNTPQYKVRIEGGATQGKE